MSSLVEIKCPFPKRNRKTGQTQRCNRICVKVVRGSSGEARCYSCKKLFDFETNNQFNFKTIVESSRENIPGEKL